MKGVFKLALIFVTTTSIKLTKQDIAISKHGAKDIIVIDKENIPELTIITQKKKIKTMNK